MRYVPQDVPQVPAVTTATGGSKGERQEGAVEMKNDVADALGDIEDSIIALAKRVEVMEQRSSSGDPPRFDQIYRRYGVPDTGPPDVVSCQLSVVDERTSLLEQWRENVDSKLDSNTSAICVLSDRLRGLVKNLEVLDSRISNMEVCLPNERHHVNALERRIRAIEMRVNDARQR